MSVILVLIPLSIFFAVCFLAAFIWAVRSGQFEDTCTPSMRVLADDVASGRKAALQTPPEPNTSKCPAGESNSIEAQSMAISDKPQGDSGSSMHPL